MKREVVNGEVFKFTMSETINSLADEASESYGVSLSQAKELVISSLWYNIVRNEVIDHIGWMLGEEQEEE